MRYNASTTANRLRRNFFYYYFEAAFPEKCQDLFAAEYDKFIAAKCPVEMEIIQDRQGNFQIKYMLPRYLQIAYRIPT